MPDSLSIRLSDVSSALERAHVSVKRSQDHIKKALGAAKAGDLVSVRRGLSELSASQEAMGRSVSDAQEHWSWTVEQEFEYLSAAFASDVVLHAAGLGLNWRGRGCEIDAPPVVARVNPSKRQVAVGRRVTKNLQPSHVVEFIKARQAAGPTVVPERMAQILRLLYQPVHRAAPGQWLPLLEAFSLITALPRTLDPYTLDEFGLDIGALFSSLSNPIPDSPRIEFLKASSSAKAGAGLQARMSTGELVLLYAFRLVPTSSANG